MSDALHSMLRVQALADVSQRYGAIVSGLATAIEDVLPLVDGEARDRLEAAARDAQAQVTAITDALDRALRDLPEAELLDDLEEPDGE